MLSAVAQAALERDLAAKVQALASDPKTGSLPPWRGWDGRSWPATHGFPGVQQMRRNCPRV
jgi:hypothetical protein